MCYSPISLRLGNPKYDYYDTGKRIDTIPIPCGKCYECIKTRMAQWCFRLKQEEKRSFSAMFVTLTYDTENVPLTSRCSMTLDKKHLQDFFKRLRYYHEKDGLYISEIRSKANGKLKERKRIKYYACGEYGEQFGRPHYHIILFNAFPEEIRKAWTYGEIHIGGVTEESIAYTLKYIEKSVSDKHMDIEVVKKFGVQSKGLGSNYIDDSIVAWHKADPERNYVQDSDYKIAIPKYYRNKIYSGEERDVLLGFVKARVEEKERRQVEKDIREGFDPSRMELSRQRAKRDKLNKRMKTRDILKK